MDSVETLVIGAGVVGLAIARRLALAGREVVILETEDQIGSVTSARNSEVIHAGIYYPKDSLKARLCVQGRADLYAYCARHHVPHRRCGKLIVATDPAEEEALAGIAARAAANGVDDLRQLTLREAQEMEPALRCTAALLSPSTGIIDSHALMVSLLGEAEAHGAMLALSTPVTSLRPAPGGFVVEAGGPAPLTLMAKEVVNAAGLGAPPLSRDVPEIASNAPEGFFAKGNYFVLGRRAPFSRLIYPTPVSGGLGIHLTLDMAGQARFGPDVEWVVATEGPSDYAVDPARGDSFYAAIRRYWPDLGEGELAPGYSGLRPKIVPQGAPAGDFRIETHGLQGFVGLYGIESPGLTACLALAERAGELLGIAPG